MKLPPLIAWPGGQSREARRLEKVFPEHDTYVEPFAGGSSFFFRKEPSEVEVLGDTNEWLIPFYADTREGGLRACQKGIPYTRARFERAKRLRNPCDRLALISLSYSGLGKHFRAKGAGPDKDGFAKRSKLKKLEQYERRLRHAHLTTGSFERTMKKFDGPSTWHLLDPPWPLEFAEKEYEGGVTVSPEEVASVAREMKGVVWVLYNDTPAIREAFSDFHQYRIRTGGVTKKGGGTKAYTKLLLTNQPLDGRAKGLRQLQGLDGVGQFPRKLSPLAQGAATVLGTLAALNLALLVEKPDASERVMLGRAVAGTAVGFMATSIFAAVLGAWENRRR